MIMYQLLNQFHASSRAIIADYSNAFKRTDCKKTCCKQMPKPRGRVGFINYPSQVPIIEPLPPGLLNYSIESRSTNCHFAMLPPRLELAESVFAPLSTGSQCHLKSIRLGSLVECPYSLSVCLRASWVVDRSSHNRSDPSHKTHSVVCCAALEVEDLDGAVTSMIESGDFVPFILT